MKPVMLVSQSNSGSTWFASCLRADPRFDDGGQKEWFNPLLNRRYADELHVLGSELYADVPHLARTPDPTTVRRLIGRTWRAETTPPTFCKENFLAFKLEAFAEVFDLMVLLPDRDRAWPPERHRVMVWYDAWFHSMVMNGRFDRDLWQWIVANDADATPEARALIAWETVRRRLASEADRLGAITLRYGDVLVQSTEELVAAGLSQPQADRVVETRRSPVVSPHHEQWHDALSIHKEFTRMFPAAS